MTSINVSNDWYRKMRWYEDHTVIKIMSLKEYLEHAENANTQESERLAKEFKVKFAKATTPEEKEFLHEYYENDIDNFNDIFPQLLRKSHFVATYSFLEQELKVLCEMTHHLSKKKAKNAFTEWVYQMLLRLGISTQITPNPKFRGDYIGSARKYLSKYRGIFFPKNSANWNNIRSYQKIRNCIVHESGLLSNQVQHKLSSFLLGNGNITINGLGYVILDEEFCLEFAKVVERFFIEDLYPNMPEEF